MNRTAWMPRSLWLLLLPAIVAGCAATGSSPVEPEISQSRSDISEVGDARNRARVNTELAALYYGRGSYGVALEVLRTALAADSGYAPAHSMLGLVYMELRENVLAEQSFERALRLAPNDADINHNYGWFLCNTGKEETATRYFLKAVRNPLYATPWKSYSAAGTCVLKKDKLKEATEYFGEALRLEPDEPIALIKLAGIEYRTGDTAAARKRISHYNRVGRVSPEALWLGLRIERKLGNRNGEHSYADQLRRRFPDSEEARKLQRGEYD